MTIHWHFEKMSPQTVVTGESDESAGSHMRRRNTRNTIRRRKQFSGAISGLFS
jgi:hypothetical protein